MSWLCRAARATRGHGHRLARVAVVAGATVAALGGAVAAAALVAPSVGVWAAAMAAAADVSLVVGAILVRPAVARRLSLRLVRGFEDPVLGMLILTSELRVIRANAAAGALLGPRRLRAGRPLDPRVHTSRRRQPLRRMEGPGARRGHHALRSADVVALIGEAMRIVRDVLGTANCITTRRLASGEVSLVANDRETFEFAIAPGQPSQSQFTLRAGVPVISNDLLAETRLPVPPIVFGNGLHRGLSVPVPGEHAGSRHVIIAHRHQDARPFCIDDARFMEAIAHVLAGALDRAATEEELRRRAMQDPLTGLANRALLASKPAGGRAAPRQTGPAPREPDRGRA